MSRKETLIGIKQYRDADTENAELKLIQQENNDVAAADAVIMGSFDAIKAIGRIETAQFYATVAEKLIAETAINLREGKKYKGLPYQDENGITRHVAHFEEFCIEFLGKSARRVQELMSNYNQLGPELYEQSEKLGFRQRDYNALKSLPADDKALIAQAIESESLENALDLMQQLAAKHQNEKLILKSHADELTKTLTARDSVIAKKDEKLNELDLQLESLKLDRPVSAHVNWPVAFEGYLTQLAITRKNLKHALGSLDVIRSSAMKITAESEAEEDALTSARELLAQELVGIHNETAEILTAIGLTFDKTLGAYTETRLKLLNV